MSMSISDRSSRIKNEGEPEVGNTSRQIGFEQDILGFKVSVGHSRFACICFRSRNFFMQMSKTPSHSFSNAAKLGPGNRITLEMRAQNMNYRKSDSELDVNILLESRKETLSREKQLLAKILFVGCLLVFLHS